MSFIQFTTFYVVYIFIHGLLFLFYTPYLNKKFKINGEVYPKKEDFNLYIKDVLLVIVLYNFLLVCVSVAIYLIKTSESGWLGITLLVILYPFAILFFFSSILIPALLGSVMPDESKTVKEINMYLLKLTAKDEINFDEINNIEAIYNANWLIISDYSNNENTGIVSFIYNKTTFVYNFDKESKVYKKVKEKTIPSNSQD